MKGRYKLLFIIVISFFFSLIIYFLFHKESFIYISIGDNLSDKMITYNYNDYINKNDIKNYKYHHFFDDYVILDSLKEDIINNKGKINYYIKNANIIILSFGTEELSNIKQLDEEIELDYLNNIYVIFSKLRSLNNNKIYIINLYENNFINNKIKSYAKEFDIRYIGINEIGSKNIYHIGISSYLNNKGHKKVSEIVKSGK